MKKIGIIITLVFLQIISFAFGEKIEKGYLDSLAIQKPQLRVTEKNIDSIFLTEENSKKYGFEKFLLENGNQWRILVDERRGVFSLIEGGAISLIPGVKSLVKWNNLKCQENECIEVDKVEILARDFMFLYPELFPVKQDELLLDKEGSGPFGDSVYFLRFQWTPFGIPVENGSIYFRFNSGNLIQISTTNIGEINIYPYPSISRETAYEIISSYIGGFQETDKFFENGNLIIVPVVPKGVEVEGYSGEFGKGIDYSLAYRFVFRRDDEKGTYEVLIDAHNGEILRFIDINRYGRAHGVVYPGDNHNNQQDRPFAFAYTGLPVPNQYTDAMGRFEGDSATINLGLGKYTKIVDSCGPTTLTTANGDADYGESVGMDCGVPNPNPAGAGNTWSTKVQYYHLTNINIKARTYFPSNSWLNNQPITVNVNQNPVCNASSGGSSLYFYKANTGCWNLGEIPGVSLHEWGHSMDNYDGSGDGSPPLETRADWTAILQLHDSCVGRGAFTSGNCGGYGDSCTDCSGIRDVDYQKHIKNTPWTAANNGSVYSCSSGSYNGPCGWEDHCESGIASQALWDLVVRDLPTYCGMDTTSSWQLVDRLFYTSMAQLGNMYNCNGSTKTSDGCGGNTLYTLFRAIDDDGDGTANGTPHAQAIFQALNRHNIACGNANDATNQNNSNCPSLEAPTLSATAGSNTVLLNWSQSNNATKYNIYRNELNCNAGFTKIGSVNAPSTTFADTQVVNGMEYYYRIQAIANSESCSSSMSNCISITPQPCSGVLLLDKDMVNCTTETINITLIDSTVSSPVTVSIFSTSNQTPISIELTNNPMGSVTYTGSFQTTTGMPSEGQLLVQAGDIVTVRYIDTDYCGQTNYNVDRTFPVDCTPPVITNVRISSKTDSTATIFWNTDEPSNSRVYFGTSIPPTNMVEDLTEYSNLHDLTITGLSPCTFYYFYVGSFDGALNYSENTNNGNYYSFRTDSRVYLYGPYNVENGNDIWSASGTAGTLFHRDTCKKHSGNYSWKAGSTTCPGNYGNSAYTYLTSQTINLGSSGHNYHLRFWEWYSTESGYDFCKVQISTNGGTVWVDLNQQKSGNSDGWIFSDIDLSAYSGNIKIRFAFNSDSNTTSEGWYVDDIEISQNVPCEPIFLLENYSFTDNCLGTGNGDEDGYIDPGEEVTIIPQIKNIGYLDSTDVYGILSSVQEGVTILDNYVQFPNLAVNQSGSSNPDHFKIKIDPSIECGTEISLQMQVFSNEANGNANITLTVGHYVNPVVTLFSQSFDGTFPPSGWAKLDVSGTSGDWLRSTNTVHPSGGGTHSGTGLAYFNSYSATSGNSTRLYQTSGTTIPSIAAGARVVFWMYHDSANPTKNDRVEVQISTDGNSWTSPNGNYFSRYNSATGWQKHSVDIATYIGQNIRIGFLGTAKNGGDCHIDDVSLEYDDEPFCDINPCTPICEIPSMPQITEILDNDLCLQNGITIIFTSGIPSTRDDLYKDGDLAKTNVTSPLFYNPFDSFVHSYQIRTVNGNDDCFSNSFSLDFVDAVCEIPSEIADGTNQSNALLIPNLNTIEWPAGIEPITGYRLYRGTYSDLSKLQNGDIDFCKKYEGENTTADISSDNPLTVEGRCYYYLVTAYNSAGEGSAGEGRILNSSGICP